MAHVDQYIEDWLMVFRAAGISDEVAQEEFGLWCEGLDGEISNEYTQNALSVINAAEQAIEELQGIAG